MTKLWLKPLDHPAATAFPLLPSALPTSHVLVPPEPAVSLRKEKLNGKKHTFILPTPLLTMYFIIEISNKIEKEA